MVKTTQGIVKRTVGKHKQSVKGKRTKGLKMEYILEPERKPAVNPFASEQIIRTMPFAGIVPLPIVGGRQINQKD